MGTTMGLTLLYDHDFVNVTAFYVITTLCSLYWQSISDTIAWASSGPTTQCIQITVGIEIKLI